MPSTSPGRASTTPSNFRQILPGAPTASLQSLDTFAFHHKRYIVYISGRQVTLLSSPTTLVQALTFNEDLVAVAAETRTGKIVVASKKDVYVLEPQTEGWTRVWWEKTLYLVREDAGDETSCLSWGNEGEVLVGGIRQLSLFSTLPSSRTSSPGVPSEDGDNLETRRVLWSKDVSSRVQYATFSPSAELIASCGLHDRLVKIWRRLSFEEGLFDHTYLPHPGAVTHLEWRPVDEQSDDSPENGITGRHEDEPEILYTIANDGCLRVWRTGAIHDLDILVLHSTIDLDSAIPQSPSLTIKGGDQGRPARYVFMLPSEQFCEAVTFAISLQTEKLSHSLEHLKEMASKEPDVVISLDGHGRMSAWGLSSIGHKRRPDTPSGYSKQAFHIAHTEGVPLRIRDDMNARFGAWFEDNVFNVLIHGFDGYVQWWRGGVEAFFSPSAAPTERLKEIACWSGHLESPVSAMSSSSSTRNLVSCSDSREIVYWTSPMEDTTLRNETLIPATAKTIDIVLLESHADQKDCIVTLEQTELDLCKVELVLRDEECREVIRKPLILDLKDDKAEWSLLSSKLVNDTASSQLLVGLSSNGRGFVCAVDTTSNRKHTLGDLRPFSLPTPETGNAILHSAAVLDDNDTTRVGFVCVDKDGALLLCHLQLDDDVALQPALITSFESGVQDANTLAVSNEFAAVTSSNGTELAIVNLRDGYVEHRHATGGQIRNIVPSPKHHLVAIGYDTGADILVQGRYEHQDEMPAWILLKRISIAGLGLTNTAMTWLGDGSLAIAAGNGVFISSADVPVQELHEDVREAIDADAESQKAVGLTDLGHRLKRPLPVWHPSLLAHSVRHGHWSLASNVIHNLCRRLKFWSEGDVLPPLLDVPADHVYNSSSATSNKALDKDLVTDLMQQLEEKDLPEVSQTEQGRLKRVVQAMTYCSEHVNGLDNGALRFLFSWKLELLHMDAMHRTNGVQPNATDSSDNVAVPEMHWREIAFAYHSDTQQPLLDIIVAHYDNKVTWTIARRLGVFAWLADRQALEQIFEALAQTAYRSASPPDPINASLYYLALHKKSALLALWRIATWHREQRATMNFLRRDFTQPDNKTAAKKNAYALMGKKRFDYAAAFFLLAEDPGSATSVLASQCDDIMLAIAVARLYSGDGSAVVRRLVKDRLMPQANKTGDRWLTSWCHSILLERDYAAEALVQPLEGIRTWHQDDPNTLTLYRQLRRSESDYEYEAVLRAARIMRRMGLWLLALELVSRWEFQPPPSVTTLPIRPGVALTNGVHDKSASSEPASMLDGFSANPVVSNEPLSMLDGFDTPKPTATQPIDEKAAREAKAAELLKKIKAKKEAAEPVINEKKPPPTQFKEPDANSLLDSFGF